LPRHRKTKFTRSKTIALVAVGAFATASAVAATWPSGPSAALAGRVHDADRGASLIVTDQLTKPQALAQGTANQAVRAYQFRDAAAALAADRWKTAQQRAAEQAAKKAAAARAAAARAAARARSASQSRPTAQPSQTATAPAASAASGSPQQIAEAMLGSFGWSSSQFSCLDPLWGRESGWSVTAANPDGAYGIPQALPGAKMASAGPDWQNDAATQIRWGLEYIQATYGSPCAAWDHELATGWY
jgi:hypothetical protein